MKDYVTFEVNEQIFEKFKMAVMHNNELEDEVIEKLMEEYVRKSSSRAVGIVRPLSEADKKAVNQVVDFAKAKRKIPRWAMRPNQMNHRIIRAYFQLEKEYSEVTLENLTRRCSNAELFPNTYCKTFITNFNQMKTDAGNSNGKVFIVERGYVRLWGEIERTLLEYKDCFLD